MEDHKKTIVDPYRCDKKWKTADYLVIKFFSRLFLSNIICIITWVKQLRNDKEDVMALPKLSDADRKAALKKAVEVRRKRAELKAKLKKGQVSLTDVLNKTGDPVVARMKVSSLLESLPGIGKARSRRLMDELDIDASRRVQGLGSKQRERLVNKLA